MFKKKHGEFNKRTFHLCKKKSNGHTELENATTEIKNLINGFKRKLSTTEERISELK